ncbi:MAG: CC0125/CC1285 family lipoprotein [Caulobacterales bacterium]
MRRGTILAIGGALLLLGCATSYAPESLIGGYSESRVSSNVWRITFSGNGYTSQETVQTYWLYHCAAVALREGFDGFRILTPVKLTELEERLGEGQPRVIRARASGGGFVYIPIYIPSAVDKPSLSGEIVLLKAPITADPGHTFDANALQAHLGPYVLGAKCGGNVCPHVHSYLYPTPAPGS